MNKLDFKFPEYASKDTTMSNVLIYTWFFTTFIVPFIGLFLVMQYDYEVIISFYNYLISWTGEYIKGVTQSNVGLGIEYIIGTVIVNGVISFILLGVLMGFFQKNNKELSNEIGDINEAENYEKINACTNISEFVKLILNTDIHFKIKETKDKVEQDVVLESNIAQKFLEELNEKIKSTQFYKKVVDDLNDPNREISEDDILDLFLNQETAFAFYGLMPLYNDLTKKVTDAIYKKKYLDLQLIMMILATRHQVKSAELSNIDELEKAIKAKLPEFIEHYISTNPAYAINVLLGIQKFNKELNIEEGLEAFLYPAISKEVLGNTGRLDNNAIVSWAVSGYTLATALNTVFNDNKYIDYPHKEMIIKMLEVDSAYYNGRALIIAKEVTNKDVFQKINELFYTNVFLGLALAENPLSADTDYAEYFDTIMTAGWNNLYLLDLLDKNNKFAQDMSNDKKRDLKGRVQDLEHQNALLSEAQKTAKSAENQAEAAKNAEQYAKQQAQYQQQAAEYQRITAEQSRVQAQYQQQAANNSAQALKASQNAQRDAQRAKENTDWMRK